MYIEADFIITNHPNVSMCMHKWLNRRIDVGINFDVGGG